MPCLFNSLVSKVKKNTFAINAIINEKLSSAKENIPSLNIYIANGTIERA